MSVHKHYMKGFVSFLGNLNFKLIFCKAFSSRWNICWEAWSDLSFPFRVHLWRTSRKRGCL